MILKDMSLISAATILVVGDSRLAAAVLAKSLGSKASLPLARTAEQALERLLLDLSIDAVVCDLSLPSMSGEALLARLRRSGSERLRKLPFVALGGNDDPRRALEVISAGASAYVPKPRACQDLVSTLLALLPQRLKSPAPANRPATPAPSNGVAPGSGRSVLGISSVMRLRWETKADGMRATPDDIAPTRASVNQQIRYAFESHLRSRDMWRPDGDGHGGVLGLTCAIEDSLRPVLRLAANLNDAANRFNQHVAISIRLNAAPPPGTIDFDDPRRWGDAPELPGAGEMTVVLPSAQFRLKLDAAGRG